MSSTGYARTLALPWGGSACTKGESPDYLLLVTCRPIRDRFLFTHWLLHWAGTFGLPSDAVRYPQVIGRPSTSFRLPSPRLPHGGTVRASYHMVIRGRCPLSRGLSGGTGLGLDAAVYCGIVCPCCRLTRAVHWGRGRWGGVPVAAFPAVSIPRRCHRDSPG